MASRTVIRGVEIAGAIASLTALVVSQDLRDFLTRDITLPRWAVVGALAALGVVARIASSRRIRPSVQFVAPAHLMINEAPKRVSSDHKDSVDTFGATVMRAPRGTFATWVYLDKMGDGIRRLVNNRYILACTTTPAAPHRNVIALCRGPKKKYAPPEDASWKVWLANGAGDGKIWTYPDGREFVPGWHLFVLRWDHGTPRLELLIDGRVVVAANGYDRYWPTDYADRVLIGCWPNYGSEHYVDTYLWRTQLLSECVNESWVRMELGHSAPPGVP